MKQGKNQEKKNNKRTAVKLSKEWRKKKETLQQSKTFSLRIQKHSKTKTVTIYNKQTQWWYNEIKWLMKVRHQESSKFKFNFSSLLLNKLRLIHETTSWGSEFQYFGALTKNVFCHWVDLKFIIGWIFNWWPLKL